jgi:hypothetical protein
MNDPGSAPNAKALMSSEPATVRQQIEKDRRSESAHLGL